MAAMKSIEEGRPLLKDCFRRCHSLSLIRLGQDWIGGVGRDDNVVTLALMYYCL